MGVSVREEDGEERADKSRGRRCAGAFHVQVTFVVLSVLQRFCTSFCSNVLRAIIKNASFFSF